MMLRDEAEAARDIEQRAIYESVARALLAMGSVMYRVEQCKAVFVTAPAVCVLPPANWWQDGGSADPPG